MQQTIRSSTMVALTQWMRPPPCASRVSVRKCPMAFGTNYCTSSITSIVQWMLNKSSEKGHRSEVGQGPGAEWYNFLPSFPLILSVTAVHLRVLSNNSARRGCSGNRSTCRRTGLGRRVKSTHMVLVWLRVEPGGKKGPGNRNPPILTSCFCWKGDPSARPAHQH